MASCLAWWSLKIYIHREMLQIRRKTKTWVKCASSPGKLCIVCIAVKGVLRVLWRKHSGLYSTVDAVESYAIQQWEWDCAIERRVVVMPMRVRWRDERPYLNWYTILQHDTSYVTAMAARLKQVSQWQDHDNLAKSPHDWQPCKIGRLASWLDPRSLSSIPDML